MFKLPTLTDLAVESGRTIGHGAVNEVNSLARYSAGQRAAFLDGLAEAFKVLAAREADHIRELAENNEDLDEGCRRFIPL